METIQLHQTNNSDMAKRERTPGIFKLFLCKCPRCRTGDMFKDKNPWHLKNTLKMHKECPVCKQPFDIEVGFYYGSSYVSYAFTVGLSIITFVLWWLTIGFSLYDDRIFYWLAFNAVFLIAMQPYLMRVARTGWLAFFAWYDKNWRTNLPKPLERINKEQEGNW